jgi:membrane-associated phospholipid phosphatase
VNDVIYLIPLSLFFLFFVFLAGLVGSSRLYLKAHQPMQVYGGFIIGIIAQFIALRFVP